MLDIVSLNGYKIKDEKAVRSYESVASMKADTKLKEGYHIKTKGYHEANDGGHGEYVIVNDDTLVDDGGSIHVLNNGLRAVLIIDDMVNVKQFGAYGDGVQNDSSYIQTALNYVSSTQEQGNAGSIFTIKSLYIPKGKYLVSDGLIYNNAKLTLYGESSILIGDGSNTILQFNNYGHHVIIKNLVFQNCGVALDFSINDVDQSINEIYECKFSGCSSKAIYYNDQSSMLTINKCHFRDCEMFLHHYKGDNVTINDCWLFDKLHTQDGACSILTNGGALKINNCFFIPAGSEQTASDLAWIEVNATAGQILSITNCRLSTEKGYKRTVNFKGTREQASQKYIINILNNHILSGRDCLIKLYTFCPIIRIENNNIYTTDKFITTGSDFTLTQGSYTAGTFFNQYIVSIYNNSSQIKTIYEVNSTDSDLFSVIQSDKPFYINATTFKKYIGNYQFNLAGIDTPTFPVKVRYYRSSGVTGYHIIYGYISFYDNGGQITPKFTAIEKTTSGDNLDIKVETKVGGTVTTDLSYISSSQSYGEIWLLIKLSDDSSAHSETVRFYNKITEY